MVNNVLDKSGNIELTDNFDDLLLNRVQLEGVKGLKIPRLFTKTDENVFGAGLNYTISYSIPIKFNKNK